MMNDYICKTCETNYFNIISECRSNIANCDILENADKCSKCIEGFTLKYN